MTQRWSVVTRDRFFYATLALSAATVGWLFWPFLDVIVFAGVIAAVASPVHARVTDALGGRPILAAIATSLLFALAIALPITYVLYLFSIEAVGFINAASAWFSNGRFDEIAARYDAWTHGPLFLSIRDLVAPGKTPEEMLIDPLRDGALAVFGALSAMVPSAVEALGKGVLDVLLFVFTVVTLLSEGPRLLRFAHDLLPLDERYQRQLLQVFREFASRMVVGAFVVALVQGAAATVGYALFGVQRALFFGVLTGVASFVPLIGTSVLAIPMILYVGWLYGWAYGLGLAAWSVLVVGSVDNVIRPLILRGSSNIHPLLIFLAVFGGLRWLGLSGVLIGPVLVAFFLALATIHREERRHDEEAVARSA